MTGDALMAKDIQLGRTERATDHYGKFIDLAEFCVKLECAGFGLKFVVEKQGFALCKTDNSAVGRIVAVKQIVVLLVVDRGNQESSVPEVI